MRKVLVSLLALVTLTFGLGVANPATASATAVNTAPVTAASDSPVLPTWAKDASLYEVNLRQFSSSSNKFKALQNDLPRLKKLGVKILWLMPVHPISVEGRLGSLGSYYAVADYKGVNPEFGKLKDFKALVTKAHELGFHVIMDWVANHTGLDNVWTSHKDWYYTQGNQILPNADWHDVADLNYDNTDMRAAMIDAMKYWVNTVNVDGFRCDFAGGVPTDFWQSANDELQTIKPLFMLAENDGDFSLLNSAFVANYGWNLQSTFNTVAQRGGDAYSFDSIFDRYKNAYPTGTFAVNFITNHDENSWNGTEFERYGSFVKRFAAIEFTVPGMPLLYNGQEIGLNRRLQFFDSDPIVWPKKASSYTDFYRKLIAVKAKNPALWNGSAGGALTSIESNNDAVLTFKRTKGKNKVIVVVNLSSDKQTVTMSLGSAAGKYFTWSKGGSVRLASSAKVTVPAGGFEIYSTTVVK